MKISVLTVVYNNFHTIRDAIDSVVSQDYHDIEYIVVDGNSTDGTTEIINEYSNHIDKIICEKDNGLYDALNKGICNATGDVIGILHSDDMFASNQVISQIANAFEKNNPDAVYGDLKYVDRENPSTVIRNWVAGECHESSFKHGWMPPHPTFFAKRECFEKYGNYDTDFVSAADYELMLRFIEKHTVTTHYLPQTLVKMRVGGKSNVTLKNRLRANKEDVRAWKKNDLYPEFYTRYMKPLRKIGQFAPVLQSSNMVLPSMLPLLILAGFFVNALLASITTAFIAATVFLPRIIQFTHKFDLVDNPNARSSHENPTSTLGGLAVFSAALLSCIFFMQESLIEYWIILLTTSIIFITGLVDDIRPITSRRKFFFQFLSAIILVSFSNIRIDSLFGIFAVEQLPEAVSIAFTVLTIVVIINAYNLIDGIDGLASGVGIVSALSFGIWFAIIGHTDYAIMAFALVGGLLGFLPFNFSKSQKIFLGDTGSLVVGFIVSILAVKFISVNGEAIGGNLQFINAPLAAFCIMGLPLFDLLRVFMVRILNYQSPFIPDKNHIHHLLLKQNMTHKQATITLVSLSATLSILTFLLCQQLDVFYYMLLLVLSFTLYFLFCKNMELNSKEATVLKR